MTHDNPFRAVHRARLRAACARIVLATVAVAAGGGLVALADTVPPSSVSAVSAPVGAAGSATAALDVSPVDSRVSAEAPSPTTIPVVPGDPAASAPPDPPAAIAATSGPALWSISIDTTGYQAEIDQCLWVRMNLGGDAPIVGAHNYCGGSIVLDMALGDQVVLAGAELDATYVVSDARDARAGDSAPAAIDGMVGDVIVQTCYWGGDGRVRLVGLTRVPAA